MYSAGKAKILITEAMPLIKKEKEILEKYAEVKLARSPSEEDIIAEAKDADIIMVVYAKITKRIIDSAKKLKGIVRYGIGVDNIDLEAATQRKIPVANVPDYCVGTVADHAFALLLALNRKLLVANNIIKTGAYINTWTSPSEKIKGVDLEGRTIGIIGLGKIGRAVAARAKGFGLKILAYDPYISKEDAEALGVKLTDLDNLLRESDFVTIHAPLTPQTRGMINEEKLKLMKKTAYLINVARGPIVDEKALYKALKEGWIAGAGMDVYEKEPPDPDNPLFKLENVVLTPHIAWYTEDALWRLEMTAVNEAIRILKGEMPKNLVNKDILKKN